MAWTALAGKVNWTIQKGTTWRRRLLLKNPDGTAMDMTGWTARMKIKPSYTQSALFSFATTPGVDEYPITIDGTAGMVTIGPLPASITTGIVSKKDHVYDLELVDADGEVGRVVQGIIRMSEEATK